MNQIETQTTTERIKNLAIAVSKAKGGRQETLRDELRFAVRRLDQLERCLQLPSHIHTEAQ